MVLLKNIFIRIAEEKKVKKKRDILNTQPLSLPRVEYYVVLKLKMELNFGIFISQTSKKINIKF